MVEINGTPGNDERTGFGDDNFIVGDAGDELLAKLSGNDALDGGEAMTLNRPGSAVRTFEGASQ